MNDFTRRQDNFVRHQNIGNYKRKLAALPLAESEREVLAKLLSEEETKERLSSFDTPKAED